jgi:hypothetical protein
MIYHRIANNVNLRVAVEMNLLADWYFVHDPCVLALLKEKWIGPRRWLDFTFWQPIAEVEDYFGPAIGMFFSWIGFYCKALVGLIPVALTLAFIVNSRLNQFFHTNDLLMENNHMRVMLIGIFASTFSVVAWIRMARNQWTSMHQFLVLLWDMRDVEKIVRPEYRGDLRPSPVDGHVLERHYPAHKAFFWKGVSASISVCYCCFVMFCILVWISVFSRNMGIFASLMLTIQIKVFEFIYTIIVKQLLDWENHKFLSDYYRSSVWKLFLFHSVNQYTAFILLMMAPLDNSTQAMLQRHKTLRRLLLSTLLFLAAFRVIEVIIQHLKVRLMIWWEDRNNPERANTRTREELQGKYGEFEMPEEIMAMSQLVISLGYVLLFGGIQPMVVPLCLIVFAVQLRSTANLLVTAARRPFPRVAGIDAYESIIGVMMRVGIFASSLWLTEVEVVYYNGSKLTEVAMLVITVIGLAAVVYCVDMVRPSTRHHADLLTDCRKHVVFKARRVGARSHAPVPSAEVSVADVVVKSGDWAAIPQGVPDAPEEALSSNA